MVASTQNSVNTGLLSIPNTLTISDHSAIFNLTANTDVTFPVSGTLATVDGGGGITWSTVNTNSTLVANTGVFVDGLFITLTLPTTFSVGDTFYISNNESSSWTIAQNSGQSISIGVNMTSTGVSGNLSSAASGDCVMLVGRVANTTLQAYVLCGNINYF